MPEARKTMDDLRGVLFDELDRLGAIDLRKEAGREELDREIDRATAVKMVATSLVETARVEVSAAKVGPGQFARGFLELTATAGPDGRPDAD